MSIGVAKRHCENCAHLRWHTRWQPSSTLTRRLRLLAAPTFGITLLILSVLRYAEQCSAWRCKFCGTPFRSVPRYPSRESVQLPDVQFVNDEYRRQQVFKAKPTNCSGTEYWRWHDKLYLGGSIRSEEWTFRSREVKERDGRRCVMCGSDRPLQTDHIVPLSQGGSNEMENLQTLCKRCHEKKTGRPLDWPNGGSLWPNVKR